MDPLSRELALGGSAGIKKFSCNEQLVDISVLNTLKGDRITPEAVTILSGTLVALSGFFVFFVLGHS